MPQKILSRKTLPSLIAVGTMSLVMAAALLVGCGSGSGAIQKRNGGGGLGSGNPGGGLTTRDGLQYFGFLYTILHGAPQEPVVAESLKGESGAVITGVAGTRVDQLKLEVNKIAFITAGTSGSPTRADNQVFTMSTTGTDITQVTMDSGDKYAPSLSPDETRIAYSTGESGSTKGKIYTIAIGGGTPTPIGDGNAPAWSPDGTQIAYRGTDGNIHTISRDGGSPTLITSGTGSKSSPAWSPDGNTIVYSNRAGSFDTLYTVSANGGGTPAPLTAPRNEEQRDPSWSPDGSKIVYSATNLGRYNGQIFVAPARKSDGEPAQLTNDSYFKQHPTWSPDGTQIAFDTQRDGANIVAAIQAEAGSEQIPLNANSSFPCLSPDWGKKADTIQLLGANGLFGTSSAGFLYGQSPSLAPGMSPLLLTVLAFETPTPETSRVTAVTTADINTLLFNVNAPDGVSRVAYMVIDMREKRPGETFRPKLPERTRGVMVAFDSTAGRVHVVMPYDDSVDRDVSGKSRAATRLPQVVQEGSALVLRGRFLAVFDAAGKNQAPNGASEIRLHPDTAELLSLH